MVRLSKARYLVSNRYVTDNEKEGTRRRMSTWRSRQRDMDRKPHEIWLTDEEFEKTKEFIEAFRLNKAASSPAATGNDA